MDKVKSIQCTQCGAPLNLYGGGHRIRTLNCEYCGAVMDTRKDYAVLAQFSEQNKPQGCPLEIGMEGEIKGVHFTIIGMVAYVSTYGDRWTDLHLYSETHGYAWLSYQLGHFTFTRRVRYLPDRDMRNLSPKTGLHVNNRSYLFFEAYQATITYVAGELTWIAKVGDTSLIRDAISPPYLFTLEETENELEYYLTEYLEPEDIQNGFTVTDTTHRSFIHPAQPFRAPLRETLSKASRPFLALSLIIMLALSLFGGGNTVLYEKPQSLSSGITVFDFQINTTRHLTEITFNNPYASLWQITDITLFDEEKEVFSFADKLSQKKDNSREQKGQARFKLDHPGNYSLRITVLQKKSPANMLQAGIEFIVREGVISSRYFNYLFFLSMLGFLIFYVSRYFFTSKRWASLH